MMTRAVPADEVLAELVGQLATALKARNWSVATAESCTGGWIAKCFTDRPGSSTWFGQGYVTYSNAAKARLLGVPDALLDAHGAVSEPVVRAMVDGARRDAAAECAVAVSGIAGPGGGSRAKPVGLVWFGIATPNNTTVFDHQFAGSRDTIRRLAVATALEGLLEQIRRIGS